MGLDTRGLMDGALRGYEVADRHYARQDSLRLADERMQMQRDQNAMSLRQAEQQMKYQEQQMALAQAQADREEENYTRLYGEKGEDGKRVGGTVNEDRKRQKEVSDAQIEASKASTEATRQESERNKRAQAITDSMPVIQQGWDTFNSTNQISDVFDKEYIKGSKYDPRTYLDKRLNHAFDVIESRLPEISGGKGGLNDPEFVDAVGVMYENNVKAVIGQQDPITGKTIENAKLGGISLANDIDPNTPGDQPGIVLTTMVDYGDGKWVAKPITNNRSTATYDTVKVIPIQTAMKDITSQLALRNKVATSKTYQRLFKEKSTKAEQEAQTQYQSAIVKLEEAKQKAISEAQSMNPDDAELVNTISARYDEAMANVKYQLLGSSSDGSAKPSSRQTNVPTWAAGDPQKLSFAQELLKSGRDVGAMSTEELDARWKFNRDKIKQQQEDARSQAMIDKVNQGREETPYYGYVPGKNYRPY